MKKLTPVISVNEDKCVNCHSCVTACPVKFCNDSSGDAVHVNADMCIGCGMCLAACQHGARVGLDDTARFFEDLRAGVKIVTVVAPAVAVSFPDHHLQLNGWLKAMGVAAAFDVSFGAELTVKSYLEHVKQNKPRAVIAQPCPAIVTYIELYRPELLPYLAPADSPMLHTIRMIREYYPQYAGHKVAVLSPCVAKRREFDETGLGDYNVTFAALAKRLEEEHVRLESYPAVDFDNPPAERAVLFSTPGGLMRTAMREAPGIEDCTRKIEGSHVIYKYLDDLPQMIQQGKAPLIIDCLNCELGCNGGTGTLCNHKPQDEVEWLVEQRSRAARARYEAQAKQQEQAVEEKPAKTGFFSRFSKHNQNGTSAGSNGANGNDRPQSKADRLHDYIDRHWKPGLFARSYVNLSGNVALRTPSEAEIAEIFREQLKKNGPEDELNCAACGYGCCRRMATALWNGLSQREHCALYRQKRLLEEEQSLRDLHEENATKSQVLLSKIEDLLAAVNAAAQGDLTRQIDIEGNEAIDQLAAGVKTMIEELAKIITQVTASAGEFQQAADTVAQSSQTLAASAQSQRTDAEQVRGAMAELSQSVNGVTAGARKADDTALKTSRLADHGGAAVDQLHRGHAADSQQLQPDQRDHPGHRRDRRPDEPAGAERGHRGGAGGRARHGLRRRGRRGPQTRRALQPGRPRNRLPHQGIDRPRPRGRLAQRGGGKGPPHDRRGGQGDRRRHRRHCRSQFQASRQQQGGGRGHRPDRQGHGRHRRPRRGNGRQQPTA